MRLSCTVIDIKPQTSDTCKWQSINGRACAHTASDRTAQKSVLLYGTGKLCSEFGEDRSISDVAVLSTDARRTDGRTDVYVILYSLQCDALHWTDRQ